MANKNRVNIMLAKDIDTILQFVGEGNRSRGIEIVAKFYEEQVLKEECSCKPNDDIPCPGCKAYSQEKHGDEIPFVE